MNSFAIHNSFSSPNMISPNLAASPGFRCFDGTCPFFHQGFGSCQLLQEHVDERHAQHITGSSFEIQSLSEPRLAKKRSHNLRETRREARIDTQFVHISFDPRSGQKRKDQRPKGSRKRSQKISDKDKENIKAVKDAGPCVRCKVLKKQCDTGTPCKSCPQQDGNAEHDFWKACGCLRLQTSSQQKEFARKFLQHNESQVEDKNLTFGRLLHSVHLGNPDLLDDLLIFVATNDAVNSHHPITIWGPVNMYDALSVIRSKLGAGQSLVYEESAFLIDIWGAYEAAKIVDLEETRLLPLMTLFLQSSASQMQGCLGLCIALLKCRESHFGHQSRLPSLENDPPPDLCICEHSFNMLFDLFSYGLRILYIPLGWRKSLPTYQWTEVFFLMCWLGTIRSMVVDIQTEFSDPLQNGTSKVSTAIQINSAYKVLVSMFCRASNGDPLAKYKENKNADMSELDKDSISRLKGIKVAVQYQEWEKRGIRSTKDFLMGLGSGFYNDGTFSGFYVQQYGRETHRNARARRFPEPPQVFQLNPKEELQFRRKLSEEQLLRLDDGDPRDPTTRAKLQNAENASKEMQHIVNTSPQISGRASYISDFRIGNGIPSYSESSNGDGRDVNIAKSVDQSDEIHSLGRRAPPIPQTSWASRTSMSGQSEQNSVTMVDKESSENNCSSWSLPNGLKNYRQRMEQFSFPSSEVGNSAVPMIDQDHLLQLAYLSVLTSPELSVERGLEMMSHERIKEVGADYILKL